jgi:hypothetical protein
MNQNHFRMARRMISVVTLLVVVPIGAACSSSDPKNRGARSTDPCTWLRIEDVRRIIRVNVEVGRSEATTPLCTYAYTSASGITTDLVVGPWQASVMGPLDAARLPGRAKEVVPGVGDHAVFYKTRTIDDGNSVLGVSSGTRSLFLAGEFLTLEQAKRLAALVLAG